jgi:uncharacterized membrane protein
VVLFPLLLAVPISNVTVKEIMGANKNLIGVVVGTGLILLLVPVAYKSLTIKELIMPILLTDIQITVSAQTY